MHIYQDISHFRAPLKSMRSVAGLGAVDPRLICDAGYIYVTGQGCVPKPGNPPEYCAEGTVWDPGLTPGYGMCTTPAAAAAAPGEITMENINAITVVGADGVRRYKPDAAAFALELLKSWGATQLTNLLVKVEPFPAALLEAANAGDEGAKSTIALANARAWVDARVAQGYAVFVPYAVLWNTTEAMAAGIQCFATPSTDKETMKTATASLLGAYAIEPATAAAVAPTAEGAGWVKPMLIAGAVAGGLGLAVWGVKRVSKSRRRVLAGSLGGA
jgi:hypothetical protein